jgi:hypothetical protein
METFESQDIARKLPTIMEQTINDFRLQLEDKEVEIERLTAENQQMREAIETAIEIIADSYDYDPQETYCECDCQAVNVMQRALSATAQVKDENEDGALRVKSTDGTFDDGK